MRIEINISDVIVTSFEVFEQLSEGYKITVFLYANNIIGPTIIGSNLRLTIENSLWIGVACESQLLYEDMHQRFHYKLTLISHLQYFGRPKKYSIYKNISIEDLFLEQLKSCNIQHKVNLSRSRIYRHFIQHSESNIDIVQYLLAKNGAFWHVDHLRNLLIIQDQNHISYSIHRLSITNSELLDPMDNFATQFSLTNVQKSYSNKIYWYNYELPENVEQKTGGVNEFYSTDINSTSEAEEYGKLLENPSQIYEFRTCNPNIRVGHHIDLEGNMYFVLKIIHKYRNGKYENQITSINAKDKYVPAPVKRKSIPGLEVATVIGPDHVSKGKVKIKFCWSDETLYVLALQSIAGAHWGTAVFPKPNQRVTIIYECGDPNRPFICGSFYDASNMTAYSDEDQQETVALRLNSTDESKLTELIVNTRANNEQITITAPGDMIQDIELNNKILIRNGIMETRVDNGEYSVYTSHDQAYTIEQGTYKICVNKGDIIITNNLQTKIHLKQSGEMVVTSDYVEINANQVEIKAQNEITINSSTVITITSPLIRLN